MDRTRKFDYEQLSEAILNARSTTEREYYERMLNRILNESDRIKYLREELMKAIRVNDRKAVEKIQLRIQYVRQDETNGHSWGNNRGENNVN